LKPKPPHRFIGTAAIDCDFCRGAGKAPSLGLGAGVIDLCHHCNGLGKVDAELGAYHVDIVIQQFQETVSHQVKVINHLKEHVTYKDPRCEVVSAGQFGATRSD